MISEKTEYIVLMMVAGLYETVSMIVMNKLTDDEIHRYNIYGKIYKESGTFLFRLYD